MRVCIIVGITLCLLTVVGCASPKSGPKSSSPTTRASRPTISGTDPCATRLHELCGVLLLYYVKHQDLPPTLDDLKGAPGAEAVGDFTCPVSHKPYVYTPTGIPSPAGPNALLIVYDTAPTHGGMRLAISVTPPINGGPLVPEVILAPESRFPAKPPTTRP